MIPRPRATLAACLLLLLLAGIARLLVGGESLAIPTSEEVLALRSHRLLAAMIVGGSLGLAGLMLQGLLRNPLASPDLIGLGPGAGFGVMLATYLHYLATGELTRWTGVAGPALLGSLGALAIVYLISQRRGIIDPAAMILVGVIVGLVFGAGTVFLQFQMPDRGQSAVRWLMGSISDETSPSQLALGGGILLVSVLASVLSARTLDACAMSEDEARASGVRVGLVRAGLFTGAGLLSAVSIVLAGPIAFVGLIAPHAARMTGGPGHRLLAISATLAGAALVVGADALVKGIDLAAGRLPVGVLTAALGGPFFLVLLVGGRRG
jgi:iron complex transport system permease protein